MQLFSNHPPFPRLTIGGFFLKKNPLPDTTIFSLPFFCYGYWAELYKLNAAAKKSN